jgi:hypothetical protein
LIGLLPALALVVWLITAQLPLWTAPQPNWFAPGTFGACAAAQSLKLYGATRAEAAGIGRDAAQAKAAQVIAEYYDAPPLVVSEPLAVEAALPGRERRAYFVITVRLTDDSPLGSRANAAAVIYLDAETGEPHMLITAMDDAAEDCDFDLRAALVAAIKSPPLLLLVAYALTAAVVLFARRIRKGRHR